MNIFDELKSVETWEGLIAFCNEHCVFYGETTANPLLCTGLGTDWYKNYWHVFDTHTSEFSEFVAEFIKENGFSRFLVKAFGMLFEGGVPLNWGEFTHKYVLVGEDGEFRPVRNDDRELLEAYKPYIEEELEKIYERDEVAV